jgi:hypothetical protein
MSDDRPVGRCLGCWHDFNQGPCGGCGAVMGADDIPRLPHPSDRCDECGHARSDHGPGNAACVLCDWCAEFEMLPPAPLSGYTQTAREGR